MLFLAKYHKRVYSQMGPVFYALNSGSVADTIAASRQALPGMQQLWQQALNKANGVFVEGNRDLYLGLAMAAENMAQGCGLIVQSDHGNGYYDEATYEHGCSLVITGFSYFDG